jgi:hypothetical protein
MKRIQGAAALQGPSVVSDGTCSPPRKYENARGGILTGCSPRLTGTWRDGLT